MGEIAEAMLDGTLCEACGTYIGEGDGFPGYCSSQCAADRGVSITSTDEECRAYLDDLEPEALPHAAHYLRIFMGVGKRRSKKLVAQWRAATQPQPDYESMIMVGG
jgi:hypothetical protein